MVQIMVRILKNLVRQTWNTASTYIDSKDLTLFLSLIFESVFIVAFMFVMCLYRARSVYYARIKVAQTLNLGLNFIYY